jgi:hypothetical protein
MRNADRSNSTQVSIDGLRLPEEVPLELLEPGLKIDRRDLGDSLASQPDSFYRVAIQVMRLTSYRDAVKKRLAEIESELDAKLRHDAEVSSEKITEKQIESEKRRDPVIKKWHNELLKASHELGMAAALKEAFVQRAHALKSMVDLDTSNFFSTNAENHRPAGSYHNAKPRNRERLR